MLNIPELAHANPCSSKQWLPPSLLKRRLSYLAKQALSPENHLNCLAESPKKKRLITPQEPPASPLFCVTPPLPPSPPSYQFDTKSFAAKLLSQCVVSSDEKILMPDGEHLHCNPKHIKRIAEIAGQVNHLVLPLRVLVRKKTNVTCIVDPQPDADPRVFIIANRVLAKGSYGQVKPAYRLDEPDKRQVIKIPFYGNEDEVLAECQTLREIYGAQSHLPGIQPLPTLVCDIDVVSPPLPERVLNEKFQAVITERFDHDLVDDILFYQNKVSRPLFLETNPSTVASPLRYVDIGLQLFQPLAYLKKLNRNHGDIKLENVLVKLPNTLVLNDWGFSHDLRKMNNDFRCTPAYVYDKDAERWNELMDRNDQNKYAELMTAADIFAMGLVYYMILVRKTDAPAAENEGSYLTGDIDLDYDLMEKNHVPPDLMTLIGDCLDPNYEARPSADLVVERLLEIQQEIIAFNSR